MLFKVALVAATLLKMGGGSVAAGAAAPAGKAATAAGEVATAGITAAGEVATAGITAVETRGEHFGYFGIFSGKRPVAASLAEFVASRLEGANKAVLTEKVETFTPDGAVKSAKTESVVPAAAGAGAFTREQIDRTLKAVRETVTDEEFKRLPDVRRSEIVGYLSVFLGTLVSVVHGASLTEEDWSAKLEDVRRRLLAYKKGRVHYPKQPEVIEKQLDSLVAACSLALAKQRDGLPVAEVEEILRSRLRQLTNSSFLETYKAPLSEADLAALRGRIAEIVSSAPMLPEDKSKSLPKGVVAFRAMMPVSGKVLQAITLAYGGRDFGEKGPPGDLGYIEDKAHRKRMRAVFDRERQRQQDWLKEERRKFTEAAEDMAKESHERTVASERSQVENELLKPWERTRIAAFVVQVFVLVILGIVLLWRLPHRRK